MNHRPTPRPSNRRLLISFRGAALTLHIADVLLAPAACIVGATGIASAATGIASAATGIASAATGIASTGVRDPTSAIALPRRPHPHRKPWPITVAVQTVPALRGIRFSWDGQTLVTNALGQASTTSEHNFMGHTLTAVDRIVNAPDRRYRFVRWAGHRDPQQTFRPTVTGLPQRSNYTITAGFSVQYPVTASFVDQRKRPVDPAQVDSATIRTDTGAVLDLPTSGPIWLDAQTPIYARSTLHARPATYSVQSVMVSGVNTVDRGRQRFRPVDERPLLVETKFFDLTIRAHDILRRARTGTSASVTFPDGTVRTVTLGPGGSGTLARIPRGEYSVVLDGASLPAQVNLSRDGAVDVVAATPANMVAISFAGLGLAIGLVVFGRRDRSRAIVTSGWNNLLALTGRTTPQSLLGLPCDDRNASIVPLRSRTAEARMSSSTPAVAAPDAARVRRPRGWVVSFGVLAVLGLISATGALILDGGGSSGRVAALMPGAAADASRSAPSPWSAATLQQAAAPTPLRSVAGEAGADDDLAGSVDDGTTATPSAASPAVEAVAGTSAAGVVGVTEADRRAGIATRTLVHSSTRRLLVVPGSVRAPKVASSKSVRVEVEEGIGADGAAFARFVLNTLNDRRGWGHGKFGFARTDGAADFRVILASPDTSARLCAPAQTRGTMSCGGGDKAVITMYRWMNGIPDYGNNLTGYRQYLINHEVGHVLGRGHAYCDPGHLAPVMVQQTKGLRGCLPNAWPFPLTSP